MNKEHRKVSADVRISQFQKDTISELAQEHNSTYSDMFRTILAIGIAEFEIMLKVVKE